jgi:hypothetical protein
MKVYFCKHLRSSSQQSLDSDVGGSRRHVFFLLKLKTRAEKSRKSRDSREGNGFLTSRGHALALVSSNKRAVYGRSSTSGPELLFLSLTTIRRLTIWHGDRNKQELLFPEFHTLQPKSALAAAALRSHIRVIRTPLILSLPKAPPLDSSSTSA